MAPGAAKRGVTAAGAAMDVPVFVFARMSSRRLPGKALRHVAGEPLLRRVVERCRAARLASGVTVVTSVARDDDAISDLAAGDGVAVFRGPLEDVAARAHQAAVHAGVAAFVRISGDSPFIDAATIDAMLDLHAAEAPDLTTNTFPRSFPPGLSVEVVSTAALAQALSGGMTDDDREHLTPWFYRHSVALRIVNYASPHAWPVGLRLTVDTAEELARADAIARRIGGAYGAAPAAEIARLALEVIGERTARQ